MSPQSYIYEEDFLNISAVRTVPHYPHPPFHPGIRYAEYPYSDKFVSPRPNPVYEAVRNALHLLGLDSENFGTPRWNPLAKLLRDGRKVIIKPNWVNHFSLHSEESEYFHALVTQGSVIRPILDYATIALRDGGELSIVDLPIQSANFEALKKKTGLDEVVKFVLSTNCRDLRINLLDLRDSVLRANASGALLERIILAGDPLGYVTVDLGKASSLVPLEKNAGLFRAPDYLGNLTVSMHSKGAHKYIVSKTVLESDLVINIPKLKVHRKSGVSICLKNVVGIVGDKSCLPHYRAGGPEAGGDEFAVTSVLNRVRSRLSLPVRQMGRLIWGGAKPIGRLIRTIHTRIHGQDPLVAITDGDWYGNDTVWRMVHDLNRALFYADSSGVLREQPQRGYLAIVDGIIGGEGEGPLRPSPVKSGLIVAGTDPIAVDVTCASLMGLDWKRIPLLANFDLSGRYPFSNFNGDLSRIVLRSSDPAYNRPLPYVSPVHRFKPSDGWKGHIELPPEDLPH